MRFTTGACVGPFEILAPLGAGGMGEVYRARDTRLDRTVAIKLLPSELVNAPGRRVERFRNEARAIARITHPNICTLYDVGEDGSAIFLVMEYVDGATLSRRLEDGPMPQPVAFRTAIGIADALDHAHRHGVDRDRGRSCMPSPSRESSARCTARPIGSCCTTSPRTAGS